MLNFECWMLNKNYSQSKKKLALACVLMYICRTKIKNQKLNFKYKKEVKII